MKTVLVISSFVAASHVGAGVSAFCLRRLGHEAIILPTTLMGRHPGWGDPGGKAVDGQALRRMWQAVKTQGIKIDAVLSGYMGDEDHIALTAEIIAHVRQQNENAIILVDPVMGDAGTLYIPKARAEAIKHDLVPLADIITPNRWELSYLADGGGLAQAAAKIKPALLVTSVLHSRNMIGAAYIDEARAVQVSHPKFEAVPHGGGDALAGIFLAHLLSGQESIMAMSKAVAAVFNIMTEADKHGAKELPLIAMQDQLDSLPLTAADIYDD